MPGGTESLPLDKIGLVEGRDGFGATESQLDGPYPIAFNADKSATKARKVRQALAHAVNIAKVRAFATIAHFGRVRRTEDI